jgi:hypothetical protein
MSMAQPGEFCLISHDPASILMSFEGPEETRGLRFTVLPHFIVFVEGVLQQGYGTAW